MRAPASNSPWKNSGSLDVLVSNAGIFIANAQTEAYRIEDFDRTVRNNIRTAFLMTKFALPHLQKSRGNIVYTGSEAGFERFADVHAVRRQQGFSSRLHERRRAGAGAVWRARQLRLSRRDRPARTRGADSPIDPAAQATIGAMIPLGRRGTPEEMANIFAFLASGRSELCDRRVVAGRWRRHAGQERYRHACADALRRAPKGVLHLKHAHDGLRGKEVYRAPATR